MREQPHEHRDGPACSSIRTGTKPPLPRCRGAGQVGVSVRTARRQRRLEIAVIRAAHRMAAAQMARVGARVAPDQLVISWPV